MTMSKPTGPHPDRSHGALRRGPARASATAITGARLAGAGAGFLAQLVLARALGAAELGLFYAVTSFAAVMGVIVVQGYPVITMRFAARYRTSTHVFLAFLRDAARRTAIAVGLACASILLAAAFYPFEQAATRWALLLTAVMLPFIAVINVSSALAAAKRRFDIAYLPEVLGRPILFLAAITVLFATGTLQSALVCLAIFVAITALVASVQSRLAFPLIPDGTPARVPPRLSRRWRREAHTAIVVALFLTAFADVAIVLCSPLMDKAETAVFGLSLKLSVLVGFIVQVAHHVASPDLAEARNARDGPALQATLRKAVFVPAVATLAILVAAAFFGSDVLALFGPEFAAGGPVLVMLIAAQVVCALAGPSVTMLTLSGAQGQNAMLCALALASLAVADLILVPLYGALGAGLAVLIAVCVWQLSALATLRRRGESRTDAAALFRDIAVSCSRPPLDRNPRADMGERL